LYLKVAEAQGLSKGLGRLNDLRKERGLDAVNPKDEDEFIEYILDETPEGTARRRFQIL
jgi:hypothetical protein